MSLSEAVLQIADAMQTEVNEWVEIDYIDKFQRAQLYSFINQLKIAVKSTQNPPMTKDSLPDWMKKVTTNAVDIPLESKGLYYESEVGPMETPVKIINPQKDSLEEKIVTKILAEESVGTRMVEAVDETGIPTYVPIDPKMPVGARTFVGSSIFQLKEDNKLYYDETSTNLYKNSQVKV